MSAAGQSVGQKRLARPFKARAKNPTAWLGYGQKSGPVSITNLQRNYAQYIAVINKN